MDTGFRIRSCPLNRELPHFIANPGRDEVFQRGLRQFPWRRPRLVLGFTPGIGWHSRAIGNLNSGNGIAGKVPSGVALNGDLPSFVMEPNAHDPNKSWDQRNPME